METLWWAQRATSGIWPDQVGAFYAWCDGTDRSPGGCLWPGYRPLSVVELVETWRSLMRAWLPETAPGPDSDPDDLERAYGQQAADAALDAELAALDRAPAGTATGRFIPALLPVAEDGSGSLLVADRRWQPASGHGSMAVFDRVDGYARDAPWRDLGRLARATVTAAHTHDAVAGTRLVPSVLAGALRWTRAQPDPLDRPEGSRTSIALNGRWTDVPGTDLQLLLELPLGAGEASVRYRRRP